MTATKIDDLPTVYNAKETEESIYKLMKDSGFNELDSRGKDYINSHISSYYKDNDGTIKFNIKAIVHDGDTIDDIKARFYTKDENPDINVNNHKFHTQNSENTIMDNPFSGDTILLNGVSEFGLKALMNEAKNGITRDGEITKTNKKMAELKTAFINGKQKLSKAYVIQNHLLIK